MSERLDWNVAKDREHVKPRAIELRALAAERIYVRPFLSAGAAQSFLKSPRTVWRWRAMQKARLFLGRPFHGTTLEIGAGTAWCSALLSKEDAVERVFCLDYDRVSVDRIMPLCFEALGADTRKMTRALGSFNATDLPANSVDLVISIGAIHHSESLPATFAEAFRVLRPEGILVASEPCEPDSLTNAGQRALEERSIDREHARKLYGIESEDIRESDNSDHNYRLVDYMAAALSVGFDVYPFTFEKAEPGLQWTPADAVRFDSFFERRLCYEGFRKIVLPPYFADGFPSPEAVFDPLLLILKKPTG